MYTPKLRLSKTDFKGSLSEMYQESSRNTRITQNRKPWGLGTLKLKASAKALPLSSILSLASGTRAALATEAWLRKKGVFPRVCGSDHSPKSFTYYNLRRKNEVLRKMKKEEKILGGRAGSKGRIGRIKGENYRVAL